MPQKRTNREYVLGGLFALLAAFPLVADTQGIALLEGSVTQDVIDRAFEDRQDQSSVRRLRWSVIRDCAKREVNGEPNVCPDPNDFDALKTYWLPKDGETATIEETIAATLQDLDEFERNVLRRAARVGQCPKDLDGMVSGFQALCEQTIGAGDERIDQLEEATRRLQQRTRREEALPSQHYRLKQ